MCIMVVNGPPYPPPNPFLVKHLFFSILFLPVSSPPPVFTPSFLSLLFSPLIPPSVPRFFSFPPFFYPSPPLFTSPPFPICLPSLLAFSNLSLPPPSPDTTSSRSPFSSPPLFLPSLPSHPPGYPTPNPIDGFFTSHISSFPGFCQGT